ncbi:hypothetical protein [Hymenobacter defluvii]|uniref:Uncharacterized protein n=1 Tax=Hymenobacter defluvii TaxID=2054411 RepID=A0ABS3THF2_9BACT|nr:hypothetical protein [Hymenobacter defluvii]MBO3273102.1 hypothetical protein [Hymenobacter defluvii]
MNNLDMLPGVVKVLPFVVHDDVRYKPSQCELLVHPEQGWSIATELAAGPNNISVALTLCHHTLAAMICKAHKIELAHFTLFTRYAYSEAHESVYVVRFSAGERNLFDEVRFVGARRELVNPADMAAVKRYLCDGQAPPRNWRALVAG